jgi:hypothetical protein
VKRFIVFAIFLSAIAIFPVVGISGVENDSEMMREEVLHAHNKYRAQLKIQPLVWSLQLATHAKEWALHLAQTGGRLIHSTGSGEGENLWAGTAGHFSSAKMVDTWGKEKKYFQYGIFPNVSTSGNWTDVGHYTQIIWRNTTEVGCAKAASGKYDIFVCRYSPPGNYIGQKVY